MNITFKKIKKLKKFYSFRQLMNVLFKEVVFYFKKYILKLKKIQTKVYSYKMVIPVQDEGIGKVLYTRGNRELDHKYIMEKEIKEGDVILDLGANIGYYVLMECMLLKTKGKIYAIEPDVRNISYLKENLLLNKEYSSIDIEIIEGAISNFDGIAKFYLADRTNLNTFNISNSSKFKAVDVKVYDFKKFVIDKGGIDLVRMDIEGHEVEVFDSLVSLRNVNPTLAPKKIVFETHKSKYNEEHNMENVLSKLFELGYYPKIMTTANEEYSNFGILGYKPEFTIDDFPFVRGIYKNVSKEDAIKLITQLGSVRTVLIEREDDA